MQCHSCGADVRPGQKFCMECGSSLRGVSDNTGEVPVIRSEQPASEQVRNEVTKAMRSTAFGGPSSEERTGSAQDRDPVWQEDPAPTQPVAVTGDPGDREGAGAPGPPADDWGPGGRFDRHDGRTAALPTAGSTSRPSEDDAGQTVRMERPPPTARPSIDDADQTMRMDRAAMAPMAAAATAAPPSTSDTVEMPASAAGRTAPYDAAADSGPWGDTSEPVTGQLSTRTRRFRFRSLLALGLLAAVATATAVFTTVVEVTDSGNDRLEGIWNVNDVGTNNAIAALIAAGAMLLGGLLWCFGFKWGAGLAGGAGAALAGWAALFIGLIEWLPIDQVLDSPTGIITRDVGYWAVAVAGVVGVLAMFVSFAGSGRDRQGGLDPWIAALGAACFVVAAGGPLIPLGSADISGNYSSESLGVDLPTIFFVGRLVQLGLLALCGVIGFLLVRRFGLGFAVGGAVAAAWMVVTAATEQTDNPIGPGFANPGAAGGQVPHGVTIVGMALAGFFTLVAIVMALLDND